MAVDESILEHIGRGESFPTLRLYAWDPACLSLGHTQPFADVDTARLRARGWEVVRRATGGRAILHTDELTYSVTGSAEEPVLVGGVLESYNRLAQALFLAVRDLGLPVEIKEGKSNNNTTPNPVCFEVPSTYEITVNGKKLIGSAQARKKEGVLQHGSLPLTGDLTRICQAGLRKRNSARGNHRLLARRRPWSPMRGAVIGNTAQACAVFSAIGVMLERGELSESNQKAGRTGVKIRSPPDGTRIMIIEVGHPYCGSCPILNFKYYSGFQQDRIRVPAGQNLKRYFGVVCLVRMPSSMAAL
jgi:lipoate-protein ligase A